MNLARELARADWASLLPAHQADGGDQPEGRATYRDALTLDDGLVLALVEDERRRSYPVPLVSTAMGVRRARPGEGAAEALVALLAAGGHRHGGFRVTTWRHGPATGERAITVDQTNESVVVGDAAVVKWAAAAEEGPHPAPSLLATLDRAGFPGMPLPWGAVEWRPSPGAPPRLLALVTEYLPGAVDGWTWVVDAVRDAAESGADDRAAASGRAVGELVARFHRALAATARPATEEESLAWRAGSVADLDRALAVTGGPERKVLQGYAGQARAVLESMPVGDGWAMRGHGDLHVGQVLREGSGTSPRHVLTDFDGNPVVSAPDRLRAQPAALDVAGMAQSFLHVGIAVRKRSRDLDEASVQHAAATARAAFLDAYRSGLADLTHLFDERLLRPLALRQVCREFIYAANHLPRWSYVPRAALPMLFIEDSP